MEQSEPTKGHQSPYPMATKYPERNAENDQKTLERAKKIARKDRVTVAVTGVQMA